MYTEISLDLINHTIRHNGHVVVSWMLPAFRIYNSLLKLCGNRKDNASVQIQDQNSHLTKKTFQTKPENNSPKKPNKSLRKEPDRTTWKEILKFQNLQ